jgi:hypothetical protein
MMTAEPTFEGGPAFMPIDRSPAALAGIARRGMRQRLTPTFADVGVPDVERTLRSFKAGQPWAADPFPDSWLRAVAHDPPTGCCWWGPALLGARVHGEPAPTWANPNAWALFGRPCGRCRAIVNPPKPKPKPKPQPRVKARPIGRHTALVRAYLATEAAERRLAQAR